MRSRLGMPGLAILGSLVLMVSGGCASTVSAPLTTSILTATDEVNSRAFASALHLGGAKYLVCFSKRDSTSQQYSIYCQDFLNLGTTAAAAAGDEFEVLSPQSASATTHVYIPYLFSAPSGYAAVFTARGLPDDPSAEWIGLMRSTDGKDWEVEENTTLVGEEDWEANSVENFGLIQVDEKLWMNYESRGPSGLDSDRSIGLAYSLDYGKSWTKLSSSPILTGGLYCAGFFAHAGDVYLIASNYNQFRVYRANTPEELTEEAYIGSFFSQADGIVVDTPTVITDDINKEPTGSFALMYSLLEEGRWNTYLSHWENTAAFLDALELLPKHQP